MPANGFLTGSGLVQNRGRLVPRLAAGGAAGSRGFEPTHMTGWAP